MEAMIRQVKRKSIQSKGQEPDMNLLLKPNTQQIHVYNHRRRAHEGQTHQPEYGITMKNTLPTKHCKNLPLNK